MEFGPENDTMRILLSVGLALALVHPHAAAQEEAPDVEVEQGLVYLEAMQRAFRRAIERAQPSVVSVFVVDADWRGQDFLPGRMQFRNPNDPDNWDFAPISFGSGVILDQEAHILTAYHAVRDVQDPRREILVRFSDGRKFQASIYAADPRSDLAVLRLENVQEPPNVTPIKIGDGDKLYPGQFVLAIGNPYASAAVDGETSASWGIISNIRRRAVPSDADESTGPTQSLQVHQTLIQTDARLNTGISGGALINIRGELIGVTMALSAAVGFETPGGFALPTNDLTRRTIEALRQGKEMEYGFVGIQPQTITEQQAAEMQSLPVDGALVGKIYTFVPAFRAGLRDGDIITHVEGKRIHSANDLVLAVGSRPADTILNVQVVRRKEKLSLDLPLAKYPVNGPVINTNKRPLWGGVRVDHLSLILKNFSRFAEASLTPNELSQGGVLILDASPGGEAAEQGLQPGQIITKVNDAVVAHPDDFDKLMSQASGKVTLTVVDPMRDDPTRVRQVTLDPRKTE